MQLSTINDARAVEVAGADGKPWDVASLEQHLREVLEGDAFKGSHRSGKFLNYVVHRATSASACHTTTDVLAWRRSIASACRPGPTFRNLSANHAFTPNNSCSLQSVSAARERVWWHHQVPGVKWTSFVLCLRQY